MKNKLSVFSFLVIILLFLFSFSMNVLADKNEEKELHAEVDYTISCVDCHKETTPEVVDEWKAGAHGKMNFGCYMCHGDGQVEFNAQPAAESCLSCHTGEDKCMENNKDGNCYDCHEGHTLKLKKEKTK